MSSRGQYVGEESLHLIHLADAAAANAPPDGRFGLIATDLPPRAWDDLPDLLPMLSAGRVKLAVWSADGPVLSYEPVDTSLIPPRKRVYSAPDTGKAGEEKKKDGSQGQTEGKAPGRA